MAAKPVAVLNTTSSHGGHMVSASGTKFTTPEGRVCVDGDLHQCPISGHGTTEVTGNASKSHTNGKAVALQGAVAGCGAVLNGNFATKATLT